MIARLLFCFRTRRESERESAERNATATPIIFKIIMRWKSLLGLSIFGIDAGLVALAEKKKRTSDAVSCCATTNVKFTLVIHQEYVLIHRKRCGRVCVRFPRDIFPVFVKRVKRQSYEFMDCERRSMEAKVITAERKKTFRHPEKCLPPPFFHRSTALA